MLSYKGVGRWGIKAADETEVDHELTQDKETVLDYLVGPVYSQGSFKWKRGRQKSPCGSDAV